MIIIQVILKCLKHAWRVSNSKNRFFKYFSTLLSGIQLKPSTDETDCCYISDKRSDNNIYWKWSTFYLSEKKKIDHAVYHDKLLSLVWNQRQEKDRTALHCIKIIKPSPYSFRLVARISLCFSNGPSVLPEWTLSWWLFNNENKQIALINYSYWPFGSPGDLCIENGGGTHIAHRARQSGGELDDSYAHCVAVCKRFASKNTRVTADVK